MFENHGWARADGRAANDADRLALRSATDSLFGDDFWGREKPAPVAHGPVRPFRLKRTSASR